jgi:hypothetical protein
MIPKLTGASLALALTFSQPANPAVGEPDYASARAASAKFQDVKAAIAEGYVRDPLNKCDAAELIGWSMGMGSVGVHYFRPDLVGIEAPSQPRANGSADFRPGILIYEQRGDGSLELVAVENLAFKWAWRESAKPQPPRLMGAAYEPMKDNPATKVDEAQMFEPHYDRHVWILRDDPKGIFAPFDPNGGCASEANAS